MNFSCVLLTFLLIPEVCGFHTTCLTLLTALSLGWLAYNFTFIVVPGLLLCTLWLERPLLKTPLVTFFCYPRWPAPSRGQTGNATSPSEVLGLPSPCLSSGIVHRTEAIVANMYWEQWEGVTTPLAWRQDCCLSRFTRKADPQEGWSFAKGQDLVYWLSTCACTSCFLSSLLTF